MICNLISVADLFLYLLLLHLIFIFIEKKRFKNFQNGEIYRLSIFYHPNLPPNDNFETIKKPDKIQVLSTPILRQALLTTILIVWRFAQYELSGYES